MSGVTKKQAFIVGGLIACSIFFWIAKKSQPVPLFAPQAVSVQGKTFTLELAVTPEQMTLGLGERTSLCDMCALLFVFTRPERQSFWMKGMLFPLDIVWLLDDTVVHIERDIPATTKDTFTPKERANRVLEWNAGAGKGLQVGDRVFFSNDGVGQ